MSEGSGSFEINVTGLGDIAAEAARIDAGTQKAARSLRNLDTETTKAMGHVRTRFRNLARDISEPFQEGARRARVPLTQLEKDIRALRATFGARAQTFENIGLNPAELALLRNQLDKLLTLQRQLSRESKAGTLTGDRLKGFQTQFESIRKGVTSETASITSLLKNLTAQMTAEQKNLRAAAAAVQRNAEIATRTQGKLQVEAARTAGKQAAAITQASAQQQVVQARAAGQQRVAITRGVVDSIGRLERGLGVAIRGIASTTVGAIGRIYGSTVGSLRRTFSERHTVISGGLNSEVRLFQEQSIKIQRIQEQRQRGLIGLASRSSLAGLGAGVGGGALLGVGFQRAADLERINQQLKILVGNAADASVLFGQIREFARVTPFDLTGVADLASRLLVIGVQTQDVLPNIKSLAGAISLVGGTTDDLNGIARALGQIQSLGKLSAEEINQISERLPGINIRKLFADNLGFATQADFVKAQEAGEISAEAAITAFLKAIKSDPRFASALDSQAGSFNNLRANLVENFADVGAAIVQRFEKPIKASMKATIQAFASLAAFIRGEGLSEGLNLLRVVLGQLAIALGAIIAAKGAVEVISLLGKGLGLLLTPAGLLVTALVAAGTAFLVLFQRSERFRKIVLDIRDKAVALARALGTNLIARLRELGRLLAPVVDRLRNVGQRLVDIGRAFVAATRTGGLAFGLDNLRRNLLSLGEDVLVALRPVGERIREGLGALGNIALEIRDRLVAGFRSIDFGAVAKALSTSLGQAIAGAGIGAVAGGIVAGPLGVALGAALGLAVARAIPAVRAAIGRIDVAALFSKLLDGVKTVGRRIGEILSDKRTLLGVAGIAAAAVALGVQFVTGFVQGILSNLGDIADAGATILNTLFAQNAIVKAVLALAIVFRRQLVGIFTSNQVGKEAGQQIGKNIADGAAQGVEQRRAVLGARIKSAFANVARTAVQGLGLALAAGLSGSALGEAQGGIETALSGAGLASATATAAAINPVLGVATLGVGALTAAFSANAKAAKEAAERVKGYEDAIVAAGDVAGGFATQIGTNITDLDSNVKSLLAQTSFTAAGFAKAFKEGRTDEFIAKIAKETFNATGNFLAVKGVTDLLEQQLKDLKKAAEEVDLDRALVGPGLRLTPVIQRVKDLTTELLKAAKAKEQLAKDITGDILRNVIQGLRTDAENLGRQADTTREKLKEMLSPQEQPTTPQAATNQTVVALPGLASGVSEALQTGVNTVLGSAQLDTSLNDFKTQLAEAFSAPGIKTEDVNKSLDVIKVAIAQADVGQGVKDQLTTALEQFRTAATSADAVKLRSEADAEAAAAAGKAAQAAAVEQAAKEDPIKIKSEADKALATKAGSVAAATAKVAAERAPKAKIGVDVDTTAARRTGLSIVDEVRSAIDGGDLSSAGGNLMTSFARGLSGAISSALTIARSAATQVVTQTKQVFGIQSPSKVFMGIGEDVMKGLVEGIKNGTDEVVSAMGSVVTQMLQVGNQLAQGSRSALSQLLQGLFGNTVTFGGAAVNEAAGNITTSLRNVLQQVRSNAEQLLSAAQKPFGERSLAERLLVGESFTSLRIGDEFGVANRSAISNAVDAIKNIGTALLEQGKSAAQAVAAMKSYRAMLISTAVSAGLAGGEVTTLVNSLGLSDASLANFIAQAQKLNAIVAEAQRQAKIAAAPPPLKPGPNPVTQINNINLLTPTDDPAAVSLAVVNRLAQKVRR